MKKLKIQKALLGICLALSTTIIMSNATNAMQKSGVPIVQQPKTTGAKEIINLEDTFSNHFQKYKERKQLNEPLKPDEYQELLEGYIQDDITKFIFLMILTQWRQLPPDKTLEGLNYIDAKTLGTVLLYEIPKQQTSQFLQYLRETSNLLKKNNAPNEDKIILSLCAPQYMRINNLKQAVEQIPKLIKAYQTGQKNTASPNDSIRQKVLSALDSIAQLLYFEKLRLYAETQQLNQARQQLYNATHYRQTKDTIHILGILENLVSDFRDAYKNKIKKQKREKEEEAKKRKNAEAEKRKQEERNNIEQKEKERKQKEEREKKEPERANKKEQLLKEANDRMGQNKCSKSKLSSTQKILNNLSVTNNMLQIIMQILY